MTLPSFISHHNSLQPRLDELNTTRLNISVTPLEMAREYAENEFKLVGLDLDELIPNFDKNYLSIQNDIQRYSLGVQRIDMPVITPKDIKTFQKHLAKGQLDIVAPFSKGDLYTPLNLTSSKSEAIEWLSLGFEDGNKADDKIKAALTSRSGSKLKPTQSEIWFPKIIRDIIRRGTPDKNPDFKKQIIIVSREGHILDGHHRYGQVKLLDPSYKLKVLYVPIDIHTLLKVGRTFGNAVGNKQKA